MELVTIYKRGQPVKVRLSRVAEYLALPDWTEKVSEPKKAKKAKPAKVSKARDEPNLGFED